MVTVQALQTEFAFTLPCGYVDEQGTLHRQGTMCRAVALDEVEPLSDTRVQTNQAYMSILLLSRVITRLGEISPVPPAVVGMFPVGTTTPANKRKYGVDTFALRAQVDF